MSKHIAEEIDREDLKAFVDDETRALVARLEHQDEFDPFSFTPPGPVAQAFILDNALSKFIMGPLGGGKTTACTFDRIYAGMQAPIAWHPETRKPTRMCRAIVLRDTFRNVERTVLESWKQWFNKGFPGSDWRGGNDRPVTQTLRFMALDGVGVEAITSFAGLNEDDIETLMKGSEWSYAWLNELDTHAKGAIDDMEQRMGRYPRADLLLTRAEVRELEAKLGHPLVSGERLGRVVGDMNAPTIDNWTYDEFITDPKPDRKLFLQPSGRSPEAENRFNLPLDYYDRIIRNQPENFVQRMVDNKFGYSRSGKPVHPSFDHRRHVADHIIPFDASRELLLGIDASTSGLSPAAALGQVQANGRIALIDELAAEHGTGPSRFGENLKRLLDDRYAGRRGIRAWIDPASQGGADTEHGQMAALEILSAILGIPMLMPFGGSNELALRLAAVDAELRGYLEPDSGLIISPNCKLTISAFGGLYRFKKKSESASNEYEDTPEKKHPVSDIMDGAQYLIGGVRGRMGAIRGASDEDNSLAKVKRRASASGWGRPPASRERSGFNPHKF